MVASHCRCPEQPPRKHSVLSSINPNPANHLILSSTNPSHFLILSPCGGCVISFFAQRETDSLGPCRMPSRRRGCDMCPYLHPSFYYAFCLPTRNSLFLPFTFPVHTCTTCLTHSHSHSHSRPPPTCQTQPAGPPTRCSSSSNNPSKTAPSSKTA